MRIGIMQPYFFPYIGYFSLIRATDYWVVLDDVQFIRHGWIERNRVLNSGDSWQYIKVPLIKFNRETKIKDVRIKNEENWEQKILEQLTCYKKRAPHYNSVIELLNTLFTEKHENITSLNVSALKLVCAYIGIELNCQIYSQLNLELSNRINQSDDWALEISKEYKATEYINPYGGKEIFDKEKYSQQNIELKFLKNNLLPYRQKKEEFESGLSIIDVLMFNTPKETLDLIDSFILE